MSNLERSWNRVSVDKTRLSALIMKYAALLLAIALPVNAREITRADRQPRLIYKISPEYTPEGCQARLEGDVLLSADISLMGKAENIRVIEPLGQGLDNQ